VPTQKRFFHVAHPGADCGFFGLQPRIVFDIPDIHQAAHHPERVIAFQIGDRLALTQLNRIPRNTVTLQELTQGAGMLTLHMLKDQQFHR